MTDCAWEARILDAWHTNAQVWERAMHEGRIESRKRATDRAILDAVLAGSARTAINVGCCEGWLARALPKNGV